MWSKDLIHGLRYRAQEGPAEDWWTNLEEVPRERDRADPGGADPLRRLREEMDEREKEGEVRYSPEAAVPPGGTGEVGEEKRGRKRKRKKSRVKVLLEAPLKDVFKRTAFDPDLDVRQELMKRARRIRKGKKKKKKGSRSRSRGYGGQLKPGRAPHSDSRLVRERAQVMEDLAPCSRSIDQCGHRGHARPDDDRLRLRQSPCRGGSGGTMTRGALGHGRSDESIK